MKARILLLCLLLTACGKTIQAGIYAGPRQAERVEIRTPVPEQDISQAEANPEKQEKLQKPETQLKKTNETSQEKKETRQMIFKLKGDCDKCKNLFEDSLDALNADYFIKDNIAQIEFDPGSTTEKEIIDTTTRSAAELISKEELILELMQSDSNKDVLIFEIDECDENCAGQLEDDVPDLEGVHNSELTFLNLLKVEYDRSDIKKDEILHEIEQYATVLRSE